MSFCSIGNKYLVECHFLAKKRVYLDQIHQILKYIFSELVWKSSILTSCSLGMYYDDWDLVFNFKVHYNSKTNNIKYIPEWISCVQVYTDAS